MIGLGVGLFNSAMAPSTITIGTGYVYVNSSSFAGAGDMNVTSSSIVAAYVVHIGSGNWTLSRQHGTKIGNFNVGVFTLGNGATAYVVCSNSSALAIQLSAGRYVVLGTSDTNALVSDFSQYVHPVETLPS